MNDEPIVRPTPADPTPPASPGVPPSPPVPSAPPRHSHSTRWSVAILLVAAVAGILYYNYRFAGRAAESAAAAPAKPPPVTVSHPLEKTITEWDEFTGQFQAVEFVAVRARVSGYLTEIHFTDGQWVKKGDLLFVIDPRPYEIKLEQAKAALQTATARVALANNQLFRAQSLKRSEFATQETVDQRTNDHDSSQAAVEDAKARVHDAELDLE